MHWAWHVLSLSLVSCAPIPIPTAFPFLHASGIGRRCTESAQRGFKISAADFWRNIDSISFGYPEAKQKQVRWLALKLTGTLSEAFIEEGAPYEVQLCGISYELSTKFSAWTMIGMARMHNIAQLVLDVVENRIPGGFAELGVWKGGACIFANALFLGGSSFFVRLQEAAHATTET